MEMSITLNANEVQEIIQDYLNNQGVNAEVTSTKCDYSGVCCKATLNPQPGAAPRQCVEPPFIHDPDLADIIADTNSSLGIHVDAAGRIMSEDEVRELHK